MAEHTPNDLDTGDRFVRLDDGEMHVALDGTAGMPAVLLIQNAAAPLACWDPFVAQLTGAHRVIRVDLLGRGSPAGPADRYDIRAQARRVGAALDRLGISRVTVAGHSSGCTVATALAEQRPGTVAGLVLIDFGPSLQAKIPERGLFRLVLTRFPGRLLWRLRTEASVRKAVHTGFARPVDIPDAFVKHALRMPHRDFVGALRGPLTYLRRQSLPDRLTGLGIPVLVIFGTDDQRWRSSLASAYKAVPGARVELLPGLGHSPILEDPQTTSKLLLDFATAVEHPR